MTVTISASSLQASRFLEASNPLEEISRSVVNQGGRALQYVGILTDEEPQQNDRRLSFHVGSFGIAFEDAHQDTLWDQVKNFFIDVKNRIFGGGRAIELPGRTRVHLNW